MKISSTLAGRPVGQLPFVLGVILAAMAAGIAVAAKPQPTPPIALGHHEVPIFLGPHEHAVTALAFAPDGKTLATGCGDSHLRMWDCATGRLKSIHAHDASRGINGLAYAPDGRSIAAVGAFFGPEAILWNTATGDVAREFPDHPRAAQVHSPNWPLMTYRGKPIDFRVLRAVAFSPDGKLLVTAPDELLIHAVDSGELLAAPRSPGKSIAAVAFTADGKFVASADDDRKVRLWSVPDGKLQATLDGPNQPLTSVAVSSDGRRVAACSSSDNASFLNRHQPPAGTLWIWDRLTGPAQKIPLGSGVARQLAFQTPSNVLMTLGNRVLEVDVADEGATPPRLFWQHSEEVQSLAISPDGRLVASGGIDRTADIVESATRKLVHRLPGLTDIYSAVNVSADGRHFAAATLDVRFSNRRPATDESFAARLAEYFGNESNQGRMQAGEVQVWSLVDGRREALLPLPAGMQVTAVKLVPDSQFVVIGGWLTGGEGKLALWDWRSQQVVREYLGNETEVLSLAVSPDGRNVVSGNAAGEVNVYDLAMSAPLHTIALDGPAQAAAFSTDGKQLAVTNGQRLLQIYTVGDWVQRRTLQSRSRIKSIDFAPNGDWVAVGTREPGLEIWNLGSDAASRTFSAEGDHFDEMPGFVTFSPDNRLVACAGRGKNIAVFEIATGKLVAELSGHAHAPTAADFAPDGRLVSGGEERTLRLWSIPEQQCLGTWVSMPADQRQGWSDQWVGYRASGEFVGSESLDRLIGWQTGGEIYTQPEVAGVRRRVDSLELGRHQ